MIRRTGALARRGAACVAAACVIAGCSTTGSSSSSNSTVKVTGGTLTIYVSDPQAVRTNPALQDAVDAAHLAFKQQSSEVKDYKLRLEVVKRGKVSDIARYAIQDTSSIAYIGELQPGFSDQTVGITNALDLLQVSPTDTALELGQATPAVADSPHHYFESWSTYHRTFARVVPNSAQEATALVAEMHALGVRTLWVENDRSDYGRALGAAVEVDAHAAQISVSSSESNADAIFYASDSPATAAAYFTKAATSNHSAKLFGPSALDSPAFTAHVSPAVGSRLYVTIPGSMPSAQNAQAQTFASAFQAKYGHAPSTQAPFGYEAMSALLSVLQQAGRGANDRTTVVKDFLKLKNRHSVLGTYTINPGSGNTSLDAFVVARLNNGTLTPVRAAPTQG